MKTCLKCNTEKKEGEFAKRSDTACGLQSYCKACNKQYRLMHRDKILAYPKSEGGQLAIKRYWQSEKGRLAHQRNARTPRGLIRTQQKTRRRRELKLALDLLLTKEDIKLIHKYFNHQCFNCGSKNRLEIDHHYPLSKGYGLTLENAVLLCKSCNASKHDKMPEEFYTPEKLMELANEKTV